MGGFPSTHNTITSSLFFALLLSNGIKNENTALAFALLLIVAIDSLDFRNQVGLHARIISSKYDNDKLTKKIHKTIGHKPIEVIGGFLLGFFVAFLGTSLLELGIF